MVVEGVFLLIDVLLTVKSISMLCVIQVIVLHGDSYVVVVPPIGSYFLVCSRPSFSTVKYYLRVVACLVVDVLLTVCLLVWCMLLILGFHIYCSTN